MFLYFVIDMKLSSFDLILIYNMCILVYGDKLLFLLQLKMMSDAFFIHNENLYLTTLRKVYILRLLYNN